MQKITLLLLFIVLPVENFVTKLNQERLITLVQNSTENFMPKIEIDSSNSIYENKLCKYPIFYFISLL